MTTLAVAATGCAPADHKAMAAADARAGIHEESAPHGGLLVGLGGDDPDAYLELLVDTTAGTLTAYVLNGEAEEFIRLKHTSLNVDLTIPDGAKPPTKVALHLAGVANALTGETEEETSEYRGQSDALRGAAKLAGAFHQLTLLGNVYDSVAFAFPAVAK